MSVSPSSLINSSPCPLKEDKVNSMVIGSFAVAKPISEIFYKSFPSSQLHKRENVRSLESNFRNATVIKVDTKAFINFRDYLTPNEGYPEAVKEHLDLIKRPGIIVSAGTERSLFDLVLSNEEMCEGLVVRDINPKVKAYVDFTAMLLRVVNDLTEFQDLSSEIKKGPLRITELRQRIEIIRQKLMICDDISEEMRNYYLENLENFGEIYLFQNQSWRASAQYEMVNYRINESLFQKLQRYAKSGNIIATVGEITDLNFLYDETIVIVDVSNIPDYKILDFQNDDNFNPRIIWTMQNSIRTTYFSFEFFPIERCHKQEMEQLLLWLEEAGLSTHKTQAMNLKILFYDFFSESEVDRYDYHCMSYSSQILSKLKKIIIEKSLLDIPGIKRKVCLSCRQGIENLNLLEMEEFDVLIRGQQILPFLEIIARNSHVLNQQKTQAISQMVGWKEVYSKYHCLIKFAPSNVLTE